MTKLTFDFTSRDHSEKPGPDVIKLFHAEKKRDYFPFTIHLDGVFSLLINIKMPTIVDILTIISRINSMLS